MHHRSLQPLLKLLLLFSLPSLFLCRCIPAERLLTPCSSGARMLLRDRKVEQVPQTVDCFSQLQPAQTMVPQRLCQSCALLF